MSLTTLTDEQLINKIRDENCSDSIVELSNRHRALVTSISKKYANAAQSLESPSSAARALAAGAPNIERVDRLVQGIAAQRGMRHAAVDAIVATVDAWLVRNRRKG